MALWQTDVLAGRARLDKLDKQIGNLDDVIGADEWDALERLDPDWPDRLADLAAALAAAGLDASHLRALGTIGRGKHFAELQLIDKVECGATLSQTKLAPKSLQWLVHSGSRGLGQAVLRGRCGRAGLTMVRQSCCGPRYGSV